MKYSVVIPCYNEEENLEDLVKKIKELTKRKNVEIVFVENGSKDNSAKKFKSIKEIDGKTMKVVYVKKNQGYGYGLQQGLKVTTGKYVGWLHADLQVAPKEMIVLMDYIDKNISNEKVFLKGNRKNRSLYDCFFTFGMTCYEFLLFGKRLNDIGAIPVLFNRELLDDMKDAPYDFSIELYTFYKAKKNKYKVKRFPVILEKRKKGASSWDKGLKSKIKQSRVIMKDSIKIRKGEQVK